MILTVEQLLTLQGLKLTRSDIEFARHLIATNPTWSRRRLSIELSTAWQWRNAAGQLKDMACRSLMLKLHDRGFINLPERRQRPTNRMTSHSIANVAHDTTPIVGRLSSLQPLDVIDVRQRSAAQPLYQHVLSRYHYLGYRSPVGENMQYLIVDRTGRPLACMLFGSAAWSCASRDAAMGWDPELRQQQLHKITNNTRFLILPWVRIPHLASHILALITRRVEADWWGRYGHGLDLLETFVDREQFAGTCYRAANWHCVGTTRGRGRNDRYTRASVPIKSVFLYPLSNDYRTRLNNIDSVSV